MVIGGLVTLLAGLIIAAGWPVDSLWILGLFLAVVSRHAVAGLDRLRGSR